MEKMNEFIKLKEKETNIKTGKSLLVLLIVEIFITCLVASKTCDFYLGCYFLFFNITVILVISYVYCRHKRWEGEECKYIILIAITLSVFSINVFVNFKVWMIYLYPVILSCGYYNKKFIWQTNVIVIIFITVTSLLNIYFLNNFKTIDLNIMAYDYIVCDGEINLLSCVLQNEIKRSDLYIKALLQTIIPNVSVLLVSYYNSKNYYNDISSVMSELTESDKKMGLLANQITKMGQELFLISKEKEIDFLTQLQNRQSLYNDLLKHKDKIQAVFMLDIDDFKYINDTYGHGVGDDILKKLGEKLKMFEKDNSCKFYRYGGEEIVGILYGEDNDPTLIARELIRMVRTSSLGLSGTSSENITISLGVSINKGQEDLVKEADIAMYRAKRNGKNCYELYDKEDKKWTN